MKKTLIDGNVYILGDCITGCQDLIADKSIDLIITDPPYGINGQSLHKHYNRKEEFVIDGYIDVPAAQYQEFSINWIAQAARILKPGGQIYIVSGYTHLYEILHALKQTDLIEVNHIIWKYNFGVFTRKKFITSHYHILLYVKPPQKDLTFNLTSRYGIEEKNSHNSSLNYMDREDVWDINREYKPGQVKNKNELPSQLLIKMIQYSSNEGDMVCDLFMGGFTTAKACIGLNRKFIGFELSEIAFNYQINEIPRIKPGNLFDTIRIPVEDMLTNRGEAWSEEDKRAVVREYQEMLSMGYTKKDAVDALCRKHLRGKWAIERVIKSFNGSVVPKE